MGKPTKLCSAEGRPKIASLVFIKVQETIKTLV